MERDGGYSAEQRAHSEKPERDSDAEEKDDDDEDDDDDEPVIVSDREPSESEAQESEGTKSLTDELADALKPKDETGETVDEPSDLDDEAIQDLSPEIDLPEEIGVASLGEKIAITQRMVEADSHETSHELAETPDDSDEEAIVLSEATFLEKASEELANNPESVPDALDKALVATAESFEYEPEADEFAEEPELTEANEVADAFDTAEPDDDTDPTIPASPVTPTASRHSHGQQPPPLPPRTVVHPMPTPPPPGGGGPGPTTAFGIPMPGSPNAMGVNPGTIEVQRNRGGDMLLGALVAWLVARHVYLKKGRRQGKEAAEKHFRPIEKSLEWEVRALHADLAIREEKIRSLTAEQLRKNGEAARKKIVEGAEAQAKASVERREQQLRDPAKAPMLATAFGLMPPPEAAPAEDQPIEEVPRVAEVETVEVPVASASTETPRAQVGHAGEVLPEQGLLLTANKIEIGGVSAKELYEQGRLNKSDLQLVVGEYVRGSDRYERVLIDKLRAPRKVESGEQIREAVSGVPATGGGSPAAGSVPLAFGASSFAGNDTPQTLDAMQAAENRLAQDKLQSKQHSKTVPAVIAVATASVVIAATLALFFF